MSAHNQLSGSNCARTADTTVILQYIKQMFECNIYFIYISLSIIWCTEVNCSHFSSTLQANFCQGLQHISLKRWVCSDKMVELSLQTWVSNSLIIECRRVLLLPFQEHCRNANHAERNHGNLSGYCVGSNRAGYSAVQYSVNERFMLRLPSSWAHSPTRSLKLLKECLLMPSSLPIRAMANSTMFPIWACCFSLSWKNTITAASFHSSIITASSFMVMTSQKVGWQLAKKHFAGLIWSWSDPGLKQ